MRHLAWLACLCFAPLAHAQEGRGGYFGAALGMFDYQEGDSVFPALTDSTSTYQLFGGYRFTDHLAVEGGYTRTGSIESSFDQSIPGFGDVTFELDGVYDIYAARLLGLVPLNRFSLFAGAGFYSASLGGVVRVRGLGDVAPLDDRERGATVSGGVQYNFRLDLRSLSIRGEYQWFDFGSDVDAWGLGVGVLLRF